MTSQALRCGFVRRRDTPARIHDVAAVNYLMQFMRQFSLARDFTLLLVIHPSVLFIACFSLLDLRFVAD